jgi:Zn-dependent protease/predicted transcriptional regulator
MRGAGLKIGRILGIPIFLHSSWFFIFALITYSFVDEFGVSNPNLTVGQRWSLSVATSLVFFGSVLFHELAHSVVARRYKIPVASITLFFFGGIARISREPDTAGQEFLIAAAGPASSYLLAGGFWLLAALSPDASMANALGTRLWQINVALATFNLLLPGFPLDGGRILRSIIWGITKDYSRSTRIAARSGQVIACGMIAFGIWIAVRGYGRGGDPLGGVWFALIGWFLLSAARQSYAQVATRGALEGLRVADIMTAEMPSVGRDLSLQEYAQEVARTGRRSHLVVSDGQLVGLMHVEALKKVPREEWTMTSVQAAMLTRDKLPSTVPEESVLDLLDRMRANDVDQIAVVNNGSIVGLVTRDAIARVVQTRSDLGHVPGR